MKTEVLAKKTPLRVARVNEKYRPSFCQTIMKMAQAGYSSRAFCAFENITWAMYLIYQNEFEEFNEACKIADMKRHLFYEKTAIENMNNKDFNSALFNKLTSIVVKWKDAPEQDLRQLESSDTVMKHPGSMTMIERHDRIRFLQGQVQIDASSN